VSVLSRRGDAGAAASDHSRWSVEPGVGWLLIGVRVRWEGVEGRVSPSRSGDARGTASGQSAAELGVGWLVQEPERAWDGG
jgi:hypothetical protein